MKRLFVFSHGWGFDKNFWQNLAPYFKNEQCIFIDYGYFGEEIKLENLDHNYSIIGIGHSLGFIKLLDINVKFDYLIGLNSFINFLGQDENLSFSRQQELNIMQQNLKQNLTITLQNFYNRCGIVIEADKYYKIDKHLLYEDLNLLSKKFTVPTQISTLILNSQNDPIITESISRENFAEITNISLQILNTGSHGLGYLEADIVYHKILSHIDADN